MAQCEVCCGTFEISAADLAFYADQGPVLQGGRSGISAPKLCFQCRLQRKLAFRNERHLYRRHCSAGGREIFSIYSPDKVHQVYENSRWYGDDWDPLTFGRDYQPERGFFEQFKELLETVPRPARITFGSSENCDFCNHHLSYKDCYLCFWGDYCERSVVCYGVGRSRSCAQCVGCVDCDHVIYGVNCHGCTNSVAIEECEQVSDSRYLRDCRQCSFCFQCVNLRHKKYHIRNHDLGSRTAYERALQGLNLDSRGTNDKLRRDFQNWAAGFPRRALHNIRTYDCTGNRNNNARNCRQCYWLIGDDNENAHYSVACVGKTFRIYDCYGSGYGVTNAYDCFGVTGVQDIAFCAYVGGGSTDSYYAIDCNDVQNVFGCVGLRHRRHCILNRQYQPAEYEGVVAKIIADLNSRGAWGSFFPPSVSPFGYNETAAADHFPLEPEQAKAIGANWCCYDPDPPGATTVRDPADLPDTSGAIDVAELRQPLRCVKTGRPFRVTELELQLLKETAAPLSVVHPDIFLSAAARGFGPFRVWPQHCCKCRAETASGWEPKLYPNVLCEDCYAEL